MFSSLFLNLGFLISLFYFREAAGQSCAFMGCYQDAESRILSIGPKESGAMTIDMCENICTNQGFRYYGLEHPNFCFCGEELNRNGGTFDDGCQTPCGGDKDQTCGGIYQLQLYDCETGSFVGQSLRP